LEFREIQLKILGLLRWIKTSNISYFTGNHCAEVHGSGLEMIAADVLEEKMQKVTIKRVFVAPYSASGPRPCSAEPALGHSNRITFRRTESGANLESTKIKTFSKSYL
jgi:hypothetical protein